MPLLTKSMVYTRKRLTRIPEEMNAVQVIEIRSNYAISLIPVIEESVVFLDETGFHFHTSRNWYSLANQKALKIVLGNKGRNILVLAAISKRGLITFKIISRPFNGEKFTEFLENDLKPHWRDNENILIMNNAKFQNCNIVLNTIRAVRANV